MLAAHRITFFESPLLTVAVVFGAMVLGLIAGSIAHRVAWRMTHGHPAFGGGAICRACGHPLSMRESIPLVGWFTQRGTCPYCGEALGIDGPSCELICSLVYASIVLRHGMSPQTLEVMALATVLLTASLASLWDYRVPNGCIAAAVLIRFGYLALCAFGGEHVGDLLAASLVGACAIGLPFALAVFLSNAMLARDVTGMGTVKIAAVTGLYLGWQQGLFAMFGAIVLVALIWVLSPTKLLNVEVEGGAHRKSPEEAAELERSARNMRASFEEDFAEPMRLIPLAPSIAIALWVMLLIGVTPAVWSSPLF